MKDIVQNINYSEENYNVKFLNTKSLGKMKINLSVSSAGGFMKKAFYYASGKGLPSEEGNVHRQR
jgi:hypothetical protein